MLKIRRTKIIILPHPIKNIVGHLRLFYIVSSILKLHGKCDIHYVVIIGPAIVAAFVIMISLTYILWQDRQSVCHFDVETAIPTGLLKPSEMVFP